MKTNSNLVDESQEVTCPICNRKMERLSHTHLTNHNLTIKEFREKYPNCYLTNPNRTRQAKCIYCGNNVVVPVTTPNHSIICASCKSKGLKPTFAIETGKIGAMIRDQKFKEDSESYRKANEKRRETLQKIFNDEEKKKEILEKRKKTYQKRTGYDHNMHNPQSRENLRKTLRDRYNVDNIMQVKEVREKFFGDNNPARREDVREKISLSLRGRESKLKGQSYEDIYGSTKAEEVRKIKSLTLRKKFQPSLQKALDYLEIELVDNEYQHAYHKHRWRCKRCGTEFEQIWNAIQQGYQCPTCFPRFQGDSKTEREIREFVEGFGLDVKARDRNLISPLELDIVIPSRKLAIEVNGVYYHSEATDKDYHLKKTKLCEQCGYQLIHIFEDEWVYKKEIVQHRLAHLLNCSKAEPLSARACTIREISTEEKDKFLQKYHIQGTDIGSKVRLGAYYNDILVAVMTFSRSNITKGFKKQEGVWELSRFCSNYDYNVRGIVSRLLSHFIRNYEWKEIFTYADRRWSTGDIYRKLAFEFVGETSIDYWYTKGGLERIPRWTMRKRKDEPKDIPEYILRAKEGYYRIYGCGHLKFRLRNSEHSN